MSLTGGVDLTATSDIGFSNAAAGSGLLVIRHVANSPRPASGQSAVLGRNALDVPGDCVQARRTLDHAGQGKSQEIARGPLPSINLRSCEAARQSVSSVRPGMTRRSSVSAGPILPARCSTSIRLRSLARETLLLGSKYSIL